MGEQSLLWNVEGAELLYFTFRKYSVVVFPTKHAAYAAWSARIFRKVNKQIVQLLLPREILKKYENSGKQKIQHFRNS